LEEEVRELEWKRKGEEIPYMKRKRQRKEYICACDMDGRK